MDRKIVEESYLAFSPSLYLYAGLAFLVSMSTR